jgi:hypothetical protein
MRGKARAGRKGGWKRLGGRKVRVENGGRDGGVGGA